MKNFLTENSKVPSRYRVISISVLWLFAIICAFAVNYALKIPSDYAMEQFLPKQHELLQWDRESKKVFQIPEVSPHILVLSFPKGKNEFWYEPKNLARLEKLSAELGRLKTVRGVMSLANVKAAYEYKDQFTVGTLNELTKVGMKPNSILRDPLYTPNLISKDGRFTAVFISAHRITQDQHRALMKTAQKMARKEFPLAQTQMGGPASIRTQLIDLLSREILLFIALSAIAAIMVIKALFRGWNILWQVSIILLISNTLALGMMGLLGISFNILTSTVPILVTICTLGNACHTLARMSPFAHLQGAERLAMLKHLIRELIGPHMFAASTTAIGFLTLVPSQVPIISQYGLAVALCVISASVTALCLVPAMYLWMKWPEQREWMKEQKLFSFYLVKYKTPIVVGMAIVVVTTTFIGRNLSWTAHLFDDLPSNHATSHSTAVIAKRLGGIAPVDLIIGADGAKDPWKNPENLKKLHSLTQKWRKQKTTGSLVSITDMMAVGSGKKVLPKTQGAAAEIQFMYSMSDQNPLRHFLSNDEKWTRVALRLQDLPADKNHAVIQGMVQDLNKAFPSMKVKTAGIAAIVPPMNNELSEELMWGFFGALFWIVIMLAIAFRSMRWALVSAIPNLAPPAILIGFLAIFNIPIKPGIAIIFSISIGIAFDNTIYVLGRLREYMKLSKVKRNASLPMYEVMKLETTPCIISSMALFAGFAIFMFSYFPVNRMFGALMLVGILAGLLADLVWLPAMLKKFPWLLLDKSKDENVEEGNFQEILVRASSFVFIIILGLMAFRPLYAAAPTTEGAPTTVEDILKKMESGTTPPNERVVLKLVTQDSDGSKKERVLTILRKKDKDSRALVRILSPADIKGLSVLTVVDKGKEDQWLYLPSAKKSRRIVGSSKKGKFLDSEISYEDLSLSTYKQFTNKVVKEDSKQVQIESKAKPNNESSYSKIQTWVSKPDFHVQKIEYYDQSGKLLKRAEFSNYQKVGGKFWRARQMLVENVQDKRKTQLLLQKLSLKKISKDEVSLSSLEE